MITIAYMQCEKSSITNICYNLQQYCSNIILCLFIQRIPTLWSELTLALIKVLKAIENKRTIARKIEFEFYIRLFAERQIHHILEEYLTTIEYDQEHVLLIMKYDDEADNCIKEYLKRIPIVGCKFTEKPSNDKVLNLYLNILKHHNFNVDINNIDINKVQKIIISIIGCGDILTKS